MTTTVPPIPMLDLTPEIDELWDELQAAAARVFRSGRFILGPEVQAFEREVADYLGVKHAIGVNSGTDALTIALRSLGVGPGDEVITTPFTFVATAEAICTAGATPVFVDIDPDTFNIAAELVEPAVTERTRAILPVHLFGLAADMDAILDVAKQHGLRVIEDTAQAFGGRYRGRMLGTLGDAGAFSFFPSKNLGALGDGGLIATNHDDLAEQARMLRAHGSRRKYHNELVGFNSRLDELQAAILRIKLPYVDRWNENRRRVAALYQAALRDVDWLRLPVEPAAARHVYHQYTVRIARGKRDALRDALHASGISSAVYYPAPVDRLPAYARFATGSSPVADLASREVLSLPIGPMFTHAQVSRVVEGLSKQCVP